MGNRNTFPNRPPFRRRSACGTLLLLVALIVVAPFQVAAQSTAKPSSAQATRQLFEAVFANDLAGVEASVIAGADIAARNDWGLTPVDLAVDRGYFEIAHHLLQVRNFRRQQDAENEADEARAGPRNFLASAVPSAPSGTPRAAPTAGVRAGPLPAPPADPVGRGRTSPPAGGSTNPFAASAVAGGGVPIIGTIEGPPLVQGRPPPATVPVPPATISRPPPPPPPRPVAAAPTQRSPAAIQAPRPSITAKRPPVAAPAPATGTPRPPADSGSPVGSLTGFFGKLAGLVEKAVEPEKEAETTAAATPTTAKAPIAKAPQVAAVSRAVVTRQPPAAPLAVLSGVTLTLGKDRRLGDQRGSPAGSGKTATPCVRKKRFDSSFCVVPVDWPSDIRKHFAVSTIVYKGVKAVARYDGDVASSYYAVFPTKSYGAVIAWFTERWGPPSGSRSQRITIPGSPAQDNPATVWRSLDAASGLVTTLEVRTLDNARNPFPDRRHGVVLLYHDRSVPIFPQLSSIDLMLLR